MHVLAAAGVFRADGVFVDLPPIPEALLEGGFRRAVLDFLVEERAISEELRAPLSLAKMSYDAASGTVIYSSKMHLGLKRNFQVMPGADPRTAHRKINTRS